MSEWTEVKIVVRAEDVDRAGDIATMVVPYGIYIEDYRDLEEQAWEIAHIDLIDEELLKKDRSRAFVHVYISPEENPLEAVAFLRERLSAEGIENKIETSECKKEEWENNWKQYFKPFEVGERFVIKPSWETYDGDTDRIILEIDPAASFGTGAHHTTQLVLCELEQYVKPGMKLLDMGCGSGILSIAAKLLGAEDITAADIDPIAVKTAKENAEKNGFALNAYLGDACRDQQLAEQLGGGYDIIAANIVADVIMAMQEMFYEKLKDDGVLIVSGIIGPRADEVRESLIGAGFEVIHDAMSSDWVAITLKKKL